MTLQLACQPLCSVISAGFGGRRNASGYRRAGKESSTRGRRKQVMLIVAAKQGGGVLDRPSTVIPLTKPDEDTRKVRQKKKPRFYKVMLHNDSVNRREYVVRVLLKVVKGLSVDDAVNVMQQAHMYGSACVIACAQEEAERYCEGLRTNGLISTVEPAGSGSPGGGEPSP